MNDIYDIKANLLWLPIDIFYSFLYIIFLAILFFVFIKYQERKKEVKTLVKEKIDYLKALKEINLNSSKEVFYSKISVVLRDFLEEKLSKPISKMTLNEIKNLSLEGTIEKVVENIYFKEFKRETEDNLDVREKIFEKVKNLLVKQ